MESRISTFVEALYYARSVVLLQRGTPTYRSVGHIYRMVSPPPHPSRIVRAPCRTERNRQSLTVALAVTGLPSVGRRVASRVSDRKTGVQHAILCAAVAPALGQSGAWPCTKSLIALGLPRNCADAHISYSITEDCGLISSLRGNEWVPPLVCEVSACFTTLHGGGANPNPNPNPYSPYLLTLTP